MRDLSTAEVHYLEPGEGVSLAVHRDEGCGVILERRSVQRGQMRHSADRLTRVQAEGLARALIRITRLPLDPYELERRGEDPHEDRGEEQAVRAAMRELGIPAEVEPRDTEPTCTTEYSLHRGKR